MTSTTMIPGLRAIVQRPRLTLEQRIELEAFWRKATERGELHQLRLKATTVQVADAMYCAALLRWKALPADTSTLDVQTEYARLKSAESMMITAHAEANEEKHDSTTGTSK